MRVVSCEKKVVVGRKIGKKLKKKWKIFLGNYFFSPQIFCVAKKK